MHRAVYFSNVLGVDMGMFYKRRDYSTIVNGKNPIVAHEFLGDDVKGKTAIIVDDMMHPVKYARCCKADQGPGCFPCLRLYDVRSLHRGA